MSTRRLLDEIISGERKKESEAIIKNRADNIITSANTLLDDIEEFYGEDAAVLLEKRLLSAIKNRNPAKFRFTKR